MSSEAARNIEVAVSGHITTVQPNLRKWAATTGSPELLPPQGPPTLATVIMFGEVFAHYARGGGSGGPVALLS